MIFFLNTVMSSFNLPTCYCCLQVSDKALRIGQTFQNLYNIHIRKQKTIILGAVCCKITKIIKCIPIINQILVRDLSSNTTRERILFVFELHLSPSLSNLLCLEKMTTKIGFVVINKWFRSILHFSLIWCQFLIHPPCPVISSKNSHIRQGSWIPP